MIGDDDFTLVAAATVAWPECVPGTSSAPAVVRLLRAMRRAAEAPHEVGYRDLAVLLRSVLRAEAEISGNKPITVPLTSPWPAPDEWAAHSVEVLSTSTGHCRIQAGPWQPEWLDGNEDPCSVVFRGKSAAGVKSIDLPSDPFFRQATGRPSYRTTGQRDAIRWLMAAAPGATLIANLPTGSGKSTVGYLPALVASTGTVVFVVPTTSLALDQARAFREQVEAVGRGPAYPHDTAYFGELSDEVKAEIRRRLTDGTQRMLFTSPEALTGGLSTALYRAAEAGLISALVIDEAHVVAQWGTEFRPDFQALAGIREDLRNVAVAKEHPPFPTVLLSATLSQDTLDSVAGLFGRPGPAAVVSSVALRPEPNYWLAETDDDRVRRERVLEALRHIPRPAIVYTTRRIDAKDLRDELVKSGWLRSAVVSGDTSADGRRDVMARFREGSLDLVVATSAFGLGVDQSDVRAVVHECVPETIDRWYQEVGRGGRDGAPCLALLVAGPRDWNVSERLSQRRVITLEKGRERWRSMRVRAEPVGDGRLRVPLDAVPSHLDVDSPENRAWNVRTLLLLHRADVLRLEAERPPQRGDGEDEEAWQTRLEAAFARYDRTAVVRVLRAVEDEGTWTSTVTGARSATALADRHAHEAMVRAVQTLEPVCDLLQSMYEITRGVAGIDVDLPLRVAPSCAGCPGCRARGTAPRHLVPPAPRTTIGGPHKAWTSRYLRDITADVPLAVLVPDGDKGAVERVVERLTARGLGRLDFGAHLSDESAAYRAVTRSSVITEGRWTPFTNLDLPSLLVRTETRVEHHELEAGGPSRVVLVCNSAADPRHLTADISEYHANVTAVDNFLEQI